MRMKSGLVAAICAVVLGAVGASGALAGEVKGPPSPGCTDPTDPTTCIANTNLNRKATDHANSICVFSGLNDYVNGQLTKRTQTPADGPPGTPGRACQGGSNPDNPTGQGPGA